MFRVASCCGDKRYDRNKTSHCRINSEARSENLSWSVQLRSRLLENGA